MAFASAQMTDPSKVGPGERKGNNTILSARTFENGLIVGRFAKLDTGSIDNMDGSATPTIAGVVLRNVSSPVEDGQAIDSTLYEQIEYVRGGLVTVEVKDGVTPAYGEQVYASNTDGSYGQATNVAGATPDIAVKAEFLEEVDTGVWLISLNPSPSL